MPTTTERADRETQTETNSLFCGDSLSLSGNFCQKAGEDEHKHEAAKHNRDIVNRESPTLGSE